MVAYADVAVACHHTVISRAMLDRLAPFAEQVATAAIISFNTVSHSLGGLAAVLGNDEQADAYFADAAAFNERAGAKFFAARTNLSWGTMLAERDTPRDTQRARELLTAAQSLATNHGYAAIERHATTALEHLH